MATHNTKGSHHHTNSSASSNCCEKYSGGALLVWEVTKRKLEDVKTKISSSSSNYFLVALFTQNAAVTIGYFLLYLAFGMCVGFLGPTMEDLACYTGNTVQQMSWAFFTQTACMVIGIFIAGYISKKTQLSADILLLGSVVVLPITLVLVALSRSIILLCVYMGIMGIGMGLIDCLANLQLVHIYDKAVAPFLQALYFCYGIGALMSPLIAEPFLINKDCSMWVLRIRSAENDAMRPGDHGLIGNMTASNSSTSPSILSNMHENSEVTHAFWILAAVQVPIVVYWAIVVFKNGCRIRTVDPKFQRLINSESKPSLHEPEGKEKVKAEKKKLWEQWQEYKNEFQGSYSLSLTKAALLTIAACLTVFIYDGLQGHANEFLQTYAIKVIKNQNHETDIGYMNVIFWASYSLGRLLSVYLATKFTPYFMLLLNILGCQIAVIIYLTGMNGLSYASVVSATVILGLFMSSVTPTTIAMTENFMDMTNLQMSLIIGGAAVGEMVIPVLEGQFIDKSPNSFVMMLLACVLLSWFIYATFWLMGRATHKFKVMASPSFIWYSPDSMEGSDCSASREESMMETQHFSDSNNLLHLRSYDSTNHSSGSSRGSIDIDLNLGQHHEESSSSED